MALVFRIIVNKKKSGTYCQQVLFIVKVFCVHKVFIALFVEYPLCFLLCHNLRLYMLKTCGIGKTVLSVSCARFKSHICKLRPPHTLCAHFLLVGRRSERLCRHRDYKRIEWASREKSRGKLNKSNGGSGI